MLKLKVKVKYCRVPTRTPALVTAKFADGTVLHFLTKDERKIEDWQALAKRKRLQVRSVAVSYNVARYTKNSVLVSQFAISLGIPLCTAKRLIHSDASNLTLFFKYRVWCLLENAAYRRFLRRWQVVHPPGTVIGRIRDRDFKSYFTKGTSDGKNKRRKRAPGVP